MQFKEQSCLYFQIVLTTCRITPWIVHQLVQLLLLIIIVIIITIIIIIFLNCYKSLKMLHYFSCNSLLFKKILYLYKNHFKKRYEVKSIF